MVVNVRWADLSISWEFYTKWCTKHKHAVTEYKNASSEKPVKNGQITTLDNHGEEKSVTERTKRTATARDHIKFRSSSKNRNRRL